MNGFNELLLLLGLSFGAFSIAGCWCGKQVYDSICGEELDEAAKTRLYEGYSIIGTQIITLSAVLGALSVAAFMLVVLAAGVNQAHGLETSLAPELLKFAVCDAAFSAMLIWLFMGPLSKLAWNRRYRPASYVDKKRVLKLLRFIAGCSGIGCAVAFQYVLASIG